MNAAILMMTYPNDGRKLQRLIIAILKQGLAKCINRINYVKSYYIREGKLKRDEEKILLIKTTEDKKTQLIAFIKKQHPHQTPELIRLQPESVDENYMKWLAE
jgi:periplasmic divalent cation tolerance protein